MQDEQFSPGNSGKDSSSKSPGDDSAEESGSKSPGSKSPGSSKSPSDSGSKSPGSKSPGSSKSPSESGKDSGSESDKEWPACMFIGNGEIVGRVESMFSMESHAGFKDCMVMQGYEAANFFGQSPGAKYPDCLFLGVEGFADGAKTMFALTDSMHSEFNDCTVISYELLKKLGPSE